MDITVSPKQLETELKVCIEAGVVPYVTSSPGMGKSSIVHKVAGAGRLKVLDLRLSQCTPEDLQGFPMRTGNKATFTPFDIFPLKGEDLPKDESGKEMNGWLLLLDELSSANKSVQAAAYKVILDRQVGSFDLHENVFMVACGNKITDKAVVHKMSTALQSRLIHYELSLNLQAWASWAIQRDFDYRIMGYLQWQQQKLMEFNPDHQDKTYPCPRTWEFLNNLIKDKPVDDTTLPRIAGTIGSGTAVEFITFCKIQHEIPDWSVIVDPAQNAKLPVPTEASNKYATISMISSRATEAEVGLVLPYIKRFDADLQIIFCRGVLTRFRDLDRTNPAFNKYAMTMITDLQNI